MGSVTQRGVVPTGQLLSRRLGLRIYETVSLLSDAMSWVMCKVAAS